MTLQQAPDRELLAGRTLAAFTIVGVLLVVFGLGDGGHVNVFVLLGMVVVASNMRVLIRRRRQRLR